MSKHGSNLRGLYTVPRSRLYAGRFGRMFRNLTPLTSWSDEDLKKLAENMVDNSVDSGGDSEIPAGYTYLGQFIDHDLTLDTTSSLDRLTDPEGLQNFRTPKFDLDSVYGSGPEQSPFMYEADAMRLRIEKLRGFEGAEDEDDLPRVYEQCESVPDDTPRIAGGQCREGLKRTRAIIGDPRNDENIIVSQLHLAFIKFHNEMVKDLVEKHAGEVSDKDKKEIFAKAQTLTRWHYQWVVFKDFLPKIVGEHMVNGIFEDVTYELGKDKDCKSIVGHQLNVDLQFYGFKDNPFMPVEFSVAAYRFGHAMVRPAYRINHELKDQHDILIFKDPSLKEDEKQLAADHGLKLNDFSMEGFAERLAHWEIDWARFFEFEGKTDVLQFARKINPELALGLSALPESVVGKEMLQALAARNLVRGHNLQLPSGEAVARTMGIPQKYIDKVDEVPDANGRETPLWYYILREAEAINDGKRLGPVGGRLVAEVFVGLLMADVNSFVNQNPDWKPEDDSMRLKDGELVFEMPDFLNIAGVRIDGTLADDEVE